MDPGWRQVERDQRTDVTAAGAADGDQRRTDDMIDPPWATVDDDHAGRWIISHRVGPSGRTVRAAESRCDRGITDFGHRTTRVSAVDGVSMVISGRPIQQEAAHG
jgi:hypothetical protein